jgi:hypothetical protein
MQSSKSNEEEIEMSRILILGLSVCVLSSMGATNRACAESVVVFDISPLVYGTAKYLTKQTRGPKRQYVRRYYPMQSSQSSSGQHRVADSSRFQGSYYVENGKHYYRDSRHGTTVVERGECEHAKDLAKRLEHEARTMCHDMSDNYRTNATYPQIYRETYRIWELAKEIQESEDDDQVRLGALVRDLDTRFQLVRREVSSWTSEQRTQRGEGTLQAKVERAEALMQHLWNDVGPAQNTWVARKDAVPTLQAPANGSGTILR